ncbi:DEAD/DEAH box helicase [Desulfocurvus sp. DL9XJH121]
MSENGSIFGLSPKGGSPKKPAEKPRPESDKEQQAAQQQAPKEPSKDDGPAEQESKQPQDAAQEPKIEAPRKKRPPRKRKPKPKTEPATAEAAPAPDVLPETAQGPASVEALRYAMSFREAARAGQADEEPEAIAPEEADEAEAAEAPEAPAGPAEEEAPEAPEAEEPKARTHVEAYAASRPDDVVQPEDSLPETSLEELPQALQDACKRAGWNQLMPVQAMAVPYLLSGRDLMIQSRTGSGKTGAFTLPILDRIDPELDQCQALVLVPTRELAVQVAHEAAALSKDTGVRIAAVYGGTGYGPQLDALREGAHMVVGTPGRVLDHLLRRSLTLDEIRILVFDEADRMLSIGFYPDMKQVQRYLPDRKVNMFMTSATYPPHVMRLAGEFMEKPQLLSLSHDNVHVANTPHCFYEVNAMEKDRTLVRIIETENPASAFIFCNTKQNVHYITAVLQRFGYDADELSGDLNQNKREQVLGRIRRGDLRFLVATDVAARGIDIPDLSHVILYEPPEDHEVYIHRAGRTGRAGASGEVISLVDVMEKLALEKIGRTYKINFEKREPPTDEDVQKMVSHRMTALLESRMRGLDNVQRERLSRYEALTATLNETEDGRSLVAMLLDNVYMPTLRNAPAAPTEERRSGGQQRTRKPRPPRDDRPQEPSRTEAAPGAGADEAQDDPSKPKRKRRPRKRRRKKPGEGGGEPNGNMA